MQKVKVKNTAVTLIQGDITEQGTDSIVNAANSTLLGGSGVDGAIHRKGGNAILEACREIRSKDFPEGLPTGEAVVTTGGRLRAKKVIHTVGPVWTGGNRNEEALLANAYRNSLDAARKAGLRSVAFPAISTGAYGFPIVRASRIALDSVLEEIRNDPDAFDEIRFVLFSEQDYAIYESALEEIL